MTMLRAGGLLDVLTSLSACRQETVEKIMERRISGGSYMCWMDFHDLLWVSMCSINFTSVWSLFSRLPRRGLPRPIFPTGYHALTTTARLSRLCIYPGYHAIVYFYSLVITQELSRSTTHVNRVITPAIVHSL